MLQVVGLLDACFGASAALFSSVYTGTRARLFHNHACCLVRGLFRSHSSSSGFFDHSPVKHFFMFGVIVSAVCAGLLPLLLLRTTSPVGKLCVVIVGRRFCNGYLTFCLFDVAVWRRCGCCFVYLRNCSDVHYSLLFGML